MRTRRGGTWSFMAKYASQWCLFCKTVSSVVRTSQLKSFTTVRTVKLSDLTKLTLTLNKFRNYVEKAPSKNTFNFLKTVIEKVCLKNK